MNVRWLLIAVTAIVGAWTTRAVAQQPVFSARTAAVRLDASVFDGARVVHGLLAPDFELSDNGVKQTIQLLETRDAPLDLVMVAQPMRSLTAEQQALVPAAAEALRAALGSDDRFGVIVASAGPDVVRPLGSVDRGFAFTSMLAGTEGVTLRDAMFRSLLMFDAQDRRKAIVVFTDGKHDQSWVREAGVQASADRVPVQIIVAGIETNSSRMVGSIWYDGTFTVTNRTQYANERQLELPRWLQDLARRTGGACLDLRSANAPDRVRELLSYLRSQYVITYTLNGVSPTGWHDVKVRLRGKKGTVVTRAGYWASDR